MGPIERLDGSSGCAIDCELAAYKGSTAGAGAAEAPWAAEAAEATEAAEAADADAFPVAVSLLRKADALVAARSGRRAPQFVQKTAPASTAAPHFGHEFGDMMP
jgi:hypothetical protein